MKRVILFLLIVFCHSSHQLYAQNIGIGTTAPTKGKLEVFGAVGVTSAIFGGDGAGISIDRNYPAIGFNRYFGTDARPMVPGSAMVEYLDLATGSLVFDTYPIISNPDQQFPPGFRRLTFRNNGNVSIATTEANASLFVHQFLSGITTARFRGTTYHTTFAEAVVGLPTQHTTINAGKNGSNVFINDQGLGNVWMGNGTGRVGINSISPTGVLELRQVAGRGIVLVAPAFSFNNWEFAVNHENGENKSDLWLYYNGQYRGNFFSVDGQWYQFSDLRLKTNVIPLNNILPKVLASRPAIYEMKNQGNSHHKSIGFIAQEIKSLFPELVEIMPGQEHGYEGITDLHTMNYDALAPVAIKAIQEQQEKIKSLTEKNASLRRRLAALENALTNK